MSKNKDPLFSKKEKAAAIAAGTLLAAGTGVLGVAGYQMIHEGVEHPTHTQLDTTRVVTGGVVEAIAIMGLAGSAIAIADEARSRKRMHRERPILEKPDNIDPANTKLEYVDLNK